MKQLFNEGERITVKELGKRLEKKVPEGSVPTNTKVAWQKDLSTFCDWHEEGRNRGYRIVIDVVLEEQRKREDKRGGNNIKFSQYLKPALLNIHDVKDITRKKLITEVLGIFSPVQYDYLIKNTDDVSVNIYKGILFQKVKRAVDNALLSLVREDQLKGKIKKMLPDDLNLKKLSYFYKKELPFEKVLLKDIVAGYTGQMNLEIFLVDYFNQVLNNTSKDRSKELVVQLALESITFFEFINFLNKQKIEALPLNPICKTKDYYLNRIVRTKDHHLGQIVKIKDHHLEQIVKIKDYHPITKLENQMLDYIEEGLCNWLEFDDRRDRWNNYKCKAIYDPLEFTLKTLLGSGKYSWNCYTIEQYTNKQSLEVRMGNIKEFKKILEQDMENKINTYDSGERKRKKEGGTRVAVFGRLDEESADLSCHDLDTVDVWDIHHSLFSEVN